MDINIGDFVVFGNKAKQIGKILSIENNNIRLVILEPLVDLINQAFPNELIQKRMIKEIPLQKIIQKCKVFSLKKYLKFAYEFVNQKLDEEKIKTEEIYLLRCSLQGRKKLIKIGSDSNYCPFCEDDIVQGNILLCKCDRLYHKTCMEKKQKCLICDKDDFINLKKRNNSSEFDFSGFDTFTYQNYRKEHNITESKKKTHSKQSLDNQKKQEQKINKLHLSLLKSYKEKEKKGYLTQNSKIRYKIQENFFKIFSEALSSQIKNSEQFLDSGLLDKFSNLSFNKKLKFLRDISREIETYLFKTHQKNTARNSEYREKAKILCIGMKKHRIDLMNELLMKKMSPKEICDLKEDEFTDRALMQKIENEKKNLLKERKMDQGKIFFQSYQGLIESAPNKEEVLPTALDEEDEEEKQNEQIDDLFKENQMQSSEKLEGKNDLKSFQKLLYSKMDELLDSETNQRLKQRLNLLYEGIN